MLRLLAKKGIIILLCEKPENRINQRYPGAFMLIELLVVIAVIAIFKSNYNRSMELYRCPADRTRVRSVAGVELGMKRTRSYSMNANLGAPQADQPVVFRAGAIREPARLFVFLDEHEIFINDASFTVNPAPADIWSNIPADRHSHGCNFSFADGHVEHWRWKYLKSRMQGSKAESEADLADLRRLQAATLRQKS